MAIDGARIQRVTKEGLFYLDDEGEEVFIDFQACYERKLAEFMQPENLKKFQEINHMSDERLHQYIEEQKTSWRYVANRDVLSAPWGAGPYIEFHTEPPIRFKFASEDEYEKIRDAVEETGWKTYDLS